MNMLDNKNILVVIVAIGTVLINFGTAHAEDAAREGVNEAVKRIRVIMQQQGFASATILAVKDGTTLGATGITGYSRMLRDALQSQGTTVLESRGDLGITLELVSAKNDDDRFLRMILKLTNRFGDLIPELNGDFFVPQSQGTNYIDQNTVLGLDGQLKQRLKLDEGRFLYDINSKTAQMTAFGMNGALIVPEQQHRKNSEQLLNKPECVIVTRNVAKMYEQSPYAVRIVGTQGVKPLRLVANQPFVDFDPNERFSIEIVNGGKSFVAATVTVDGLNTFYSSETPDAHGLSWILPGLKSDRTSFGSLTLEGWYKKQGVADKFIATTYQRSRRLAAGLEETLVGGITVVFGDVQKKKEVIAKTKQSITDLVPIERGGLAIVHLQNGNIESIEELKGDFTRQVSKEVEYTRTIYIGGDGDVKQTEGNPSDYVAAEGKEFGSITIRYRHPDA